MRAYRSLVLVAATVVCCVRVGYGQCPTQRWLDPNGGSQDALGSAIAASGQTVLVGEKGENSDTGAVMVLERVGGAWIPGDVLRASDGQTGDYFGNTVAIDGDLAAVGAPVAWGAAPYGGVVYPFRRVAGAWIEEPRLLDPGGTGWSEFGRSLAIEADTLLVGQWGPFGAISHAYVYARGPGGWVLAQTLDPLPGTLIPTGFGLFVDLDGDRLVVGEPWPSTPGGLVHVFERQGGVWGRVQVLSLPAPGPVAMVGQLDLDGDRLAVAVPDDEGLGPASGAIHIFERGLAGWSHAAKFFPADGLPEDRVGSDLVLDGERLIFGRPTDGPGNAGSAYLYVRDEGEWRQASRWGAGMPSARNFGSALTLLGDEAFVGAPQSAPASGLLVGSLHLFSLAGGWSHAYCGAVPNSTGAAATLAVSGEPSLGGGPLLFQAAALPPFVPALLLHGRDPAQLPFGDGVLCIAPYAPAFGRVLPAALADAGGAAAVSFDPLGVSPQVGLVAGLPWSFQLVYRDPGGALGLNLTNALRAAFCP